MIPDIGPEGGVGTMMLMMDPPQHTRYRKIVSSAFTPRVIKLFEEQVRRRVGGDRRQRDRRAAGATS